MNCFLQIKKDKKANNKFRLGLEVSRMTDVGSTRHTVFHDSYRIRPIHCESLSETTTVGRK